MYEGEMLKYGCINPENKTAVPVTMAASQTIVAASGKFVYMSDGSATLCADSTTYIFGWIETEADSSTSAEVRNCIIDLSAMFRIPVNAGTYVVGMQGDLCDISISSNVQGANLSTSTENQLILANGDTTNNKWVDVMINPAVQGASLGCDA